MNKIVPLVAPYVNYDVDVCNLGRFGMLFSGSPCSIQQQYQASPLSNIILQ